MISLLLRVRDMAFVRDTREHPVQNFVHEVQPTLPCDSMRPSIIRLPSKNPHQVTPKKSKQRSTKILITLVVDEYDVPCMVCRDKHLLTFLENGIFFIPLLCHLGRSFSYFLSKNG